MTAPQNENITLYYREGSSDKVYQASIEPAGELFVVNYAYGRRGATLNSGTKTSTPVDYATAKKTFDKLVGDKTAKGYTPGPDGTPYRQTNKEERATGILPQLLNPIAEDEVNGFLRDPAWCMQEKHDGRRVLLMKIGPVISGVNRKGLTIGLPESVMRSAEALQADFILDGESIGDTLHVFDILALNGENLQDQPYRSRLVALTNLLAANQVNVQLVQTAFTKEEKTGLLAELQDHKKEGVVFKRLDAPYTAGRPSVGGTQLKYKFVATLSAVVAKVNAKRSVELKLKSPDGWQPAGNVTIPANHAVPPAGAVVEVRFLYAMPESGALYQPVYLGERSDISPDDCTVSQLKFKPSEEEA